MKDRAVSPGPLRFAYTKSYTNGELKLPQSRVTWIGLRLRPMTLTTVSIPQMTTECENVWSA
jgi:hypothetical protein